MRHQLQFLLRPEWILPALVSFSLFFLAKAAPSILPPQNDLVQYWSTAVALFEGGNPYDQSVLHEIELRADSDTELIRIWNPPVVFPIVVPLGTVSYGTARALWFALSIGIFLHALLHLWRVYASDASPRIFQVMALVCFVPLYDALVFGQISPILLVAVLPLFSHAARGKAFSLSTGVVFSLSLVKPHLFVLVYLWLFFELRRKAVQSFATGFIGGAVLLASLSFVLFPAGFSLYSEAMQTPPIYFRTPTLGSLLQGLTGVHSVLVRFTPLIVGLVVLTLCRWRQKQGVISDPGYDFERLLTLLPMSLLLSPYGWLFDQMVYLPLLGFVVWVKRDVLLSSLLTLVHLFVALTPGSWGQEKGLVTSAVYCLLFVYLFGGKLCRRSSSVPEPTRS